MALNRVEKKLATVNVRTVHLHARKLRPQSHQPPSPGLMTLGERARGCSPGPLFLPPDDEPLHYFDSLSHCRRVFARQSVSSLCTSALAKAAQYIILAAVSLLFVSPKTALYLPGHPLIMAEHCASIDVDFSTAPKDVILTAATPPPLPSS